MRPKRCKDFNNQQYVHFVLSNTSVCIVHSFTRASEHMGQGVSVENDEVHGEISITAHSRKGKELGTKGIKIKFSIDSTVGEIAEALAERDDFKEFLSEFYENHQELVDDIGKLRIRDGDAFKTVKSLAMKKLSEMDLFKKNTDNTNPEMDIAAEKVMRDDSQ